MRARRMIGRGLAALLTAAAAVGATGPARAPQLAALNAIERGQWQLREIGASAPPRALCIADPRVLLQLRHPGAQCSRFVITDTGNSATIHYTCPGAGHGRTTITVETARLLQLETQGVAGGLPFAAEYEARRTGQCTPGSH